MYRPTKNWSQASLNPEEREAFRQAAREQAKDEFNDYLDSNSLYCEENLKDLFRQYDLYDLYEDAFAESENAYVLYAQAYDPHVDPEESFKLMVEAMAVERRVRVYNEVIDEKEARLAAKNQNPER